MPIVRIPVGHRFGIICHSHQVELRRRILEKTLSPPSLVKAGSERFRGDVFEEFVLEFNRAETLVEKQRVETLAKAFVERIKRKLGCNKDFSGSCVDVPGAWTELSLLAQCRDNQLQEECLDLLVSSLDRQYLDSDEIVVLFYLAETALYWLRMESVTQSYINFFELQLLTMARLVFVRLYFHHIAGHLGSFQELKHELSKYLDGLDNVQEIYSSFPDALLCLRYVCDVGKLITGNRSNAGSMMLIDDEQSATSRCSVSMTVHELAPFLWHSLDVWRCVMHAKGDVKRALDSLISCSAHITVDDWIDTECALKILGDAAKVSLEVLSVLEDIAKGLHNCTLVSNGTSDSNCCRTLSGREETFLSDFSMSRCKVKDLSIVNGLSGAEDKLLESGTEPINHTKMGLCCWSWELCVTYVHILTEICVCGSLSVIRKRALTGQYHDRSSIACNSITMPSAGLLDLLQFSACIKPDNQALHDWSWCVRYTAVQGLARICHRSNEDQLRDGLQKVSQTALEKAKSREWDLRVLEAAKMSPINASVLYSSTQTSIGARIAEALSHLYLPPVSPVFALPVVTVHADKNRSHTKAATNMLPNLSVRDTTASVRRSTTCAKASFETRTSKQLFEIVTQQWQMELNQHDDEDNRESRKKN